MTNERKDIRNIAIIAHVDHGKTTLVDAMLRQSGTFRDNEQVRDRVMDSMDLERERGITIMAKNTSVHYQRREDQHRRHAGPRGFRRRSRTRFEDGRRRDAAGRCRRRLFAANAVRAAQSARSAAAGDRRRQQDRSQDARPEEVVDEIYELFLDLDATDEQIEFPILYCVSREGIAKEELDDESTNLQPLFDQIVETIPAPKQIAQRLAATAGRQSRLQRLRRSPGDRTNLLRRDRDWRSGCGREARSVDSEKYEFRSFMLSKV